MQIFLLTIVASLYLGGFYIMHLRYDAKIGLTVRDLIILIFSPFAVLPILIMPILSRFINLDHVLLKKK